MKAVHKGNDMFVWRMTWFGNSICYQIFPIVLDHKLGLIGSGMCSAVLAISQMVSVIVDYT